MEADERQRQILARARHDGRVEVGSLADDLAGRPGDRTPRPAPARRARRAAAGARRRPPGRERRLREQPHAPLHLADRREAAHRRGRRRAARRRRVGLHRRGRHAPVRRRGDPAPCSRAPSSPWSPPRCWPPARSPTPRTSPSCCSAAGCAGCTMATVDHWATRMLNELVIDLAFLGANGISREHGLTTPDPAVAAVKAQVVASVAPADLRRRAHQVRRLQLLPVRRHPRLRGAGDRHRRQRRARPTATASSGPRWSGPSSVRSRTITTSTTQRHRDNSAPDNWR